MNEFAELKAQILATTGERFYVSPRTIARHALRNRDNSKGKKLRIAILTKGVRKTV